MDKAQIDTLISHWMEATHEVCEDYRVERLESMTDEEVDDQETGCAMAAEDSQDMLRSGNYQDVHGEVRDLLSAASMALDPESPAFTKLAREFLKARLALYQEEGRRWNGKYQAPVRQLQVAPSSTSTSTATPHVTPTQSFSAVVALYLKEHATRRPRTQAMIEASFKVFVKVIGGDRPIGNITKDDCRKYKAYMVEEQGNKAATVNKKLKNLEHLFKWTKGQGFVGDAHVSPVTGLKIDKRIEKKEAQKKLPFTTQQLQEIITHPEFLRNKTEHPNWWWITWIAIYQGLRLAEPAQLLVSQVVKDVDSGVWYFNIEEAPDTTQSVKSASGWRKVPIHQALIDKLGFLDYLAATKRAGHTRLFYQSSYTVKGWGDSTGIWFNQFIRKRLKYGKSWTFHCLRHTVTTRLTIAGVSLEFVLALVGHAGPGGELHAGYVHRSSFPLATLRDAVNKMDLG